MVRQEIVSRSLRSAGYNPQTQILEIEFQDGDVYEYRGVPEKVYQELVIAESKGGYFTQAIRDHYSYRKIS